MSSTGSGQPPAIPIPPPKQIRFVNNEGHPPSKRRRVNVACRTCRKRKTRCDGKRPECTTCTENGHECLGYAEGGDGRRESRGAYANRTGEEGNEEYEEGRAAPVHIQNLHGSYPNGLSKLHRAEPSSYFERPPDESTGKSVDQYRDTAVFSDEEPSPLAELANNLGQTAAESHRVPYFRYFGPTAIVPGFKQMVVSVREHRRSTGTGSAIAMSPGSSIGAGSNHGKTSSQAGTETRSVDIPIYDQSDALPVHRLIVHLVETFFTHLGCNYPFLRQKTFTQRVEERSVEPILVDAVCSLAARFSDHALLTTGRDPSYPKSDYGHVFAQRAKAAVVDTFPCPTVPAVQACLLLAYEGFGSNQDSALWMYLGCAIRMAIDLGLQKLDGVKHQGQRDPGNHRSNSDSNHSDALTTISAQEKMEIEQERIDTLWAVFMLDRVISSGTGRPVTMRDDDFELTFPAITSNPQSGWPNPFPALIQIIHLYGRVSDLLNNIKDAQDVTPNKIKGLSAMEKDLTNLYQKLDQRLNFNAANFQYYVKSGEGTNFILVHFWFHTLIMLLHQPTLMHPFEGKILQLFPNSRELSMSSAKTIADILSFAELIDPKSFIGNPFTSQPMYIAACAFLMESAAHTSSQPASRDASPPQNSRVLKAKEKNPTDKPSDQKQKHSLLASAATQNYQRCYKSLQQLETYWAGTRYILVALDQKAKGIWDPETYTEQEYESTKRHDMIPAWRRKLSLAAAPSPSRFSDLARSPRMTAGSPTIDPSHAFGFSLTGTTNSPSSNLTFMYQNVNGEQALSQPPPPGAGNMIYDPIRQSLPETTPGSTSTSNYQSRYQNYPQLQRQTSGTMPPPAPKYTPMASDPASTSDAEMLLGLQGSPFSQTPGQHQTFDPSINASPAAQQDGSFAFSPQNQQLFGQPNPNYMGLGGVGDMMMESQEIDVSTLGGDMIPWLEYLPQDMLQFFDGGNGGGMPSNNHLDNNANLGNIDRSGG